MKTTVYCRLIWHWPDQAPPAAVARVRVGDVLTISAADAPVWIGAVANAAEGTKSAASAAAAAAAVAVAESYPCVQLRHPSQLTMVNGAVFSDVQSK